MTMPKSTDLRDPQPGEGISPPQTLQGVGFTLQPREVKVFKPTGAPVHLYDIMTDATKRVGIASLVLEPDFRQVENVGHVCANLAGDQADPALLANVGELLIAHAYEQGLPSVRIVVPADHAPSVAACEAQGGLCHREVNNYDGKSFACFDYPATEE